MASLKHCMSKLVEAGEISPALVTEAERLVKEYKDDGYSRERAEIVVIDELLREAKSELSSVYKQIGVKNFTLSALPDELSVFGKGRVTMKDMRDAVAREPYKRFLTEYVADSDNIGMVIEARRALLRNDMKKIRKLVKKIEGQKEEYLNTKLDEGRVSESVNEETGNEVTTLNQIDEAAGASGKSYLKRDLDEDGNPTGSVMEVSVEHHGISETEEMVGDKYPYSHRNTEHSLDLDMMGQTIPNRDIAKPVNTKQIKFIKDLLTKGVPAFVKAVKAMTEQQRHNIRAATRELLRTEQMGDLKPRAEAALKALRTLFKDEGVKTGMVEGEEADGYMVMNGKDGRDAAARMGKKVDVDETTLKSEPVDSVIQNILGAFQKITGRTPVRDAIKAAMKTGDTASVLRVIGEESKSPLTKAITIAVTKLVSAGEPIGIHVGKFGVTDWSGKFDYDNKGKPRISINDDSLRSEADYARVFLHEIIHAVSENVISSTRESVRHSLAQMVGVRMLQDVFEAVKADGKLAGEYGLKNLHEFLAEALSNPKFQKKLRGISSQGENVVPPGIRNDVKSLWDQFVAALRNIVGVDNALADSLKAFAIIAEAPQIDKDHRGVKYNTTLSTEIHNDLGKDGIPATHDSPSNAQSPISRPPLTKDEVTALKERIVKQVGDKIKTVFAKQIKDGDALVSGQWEPGTGDVEGIIRVAITAEDPNGVADHEAMHQFFTWLHKHGSSKTIALLERMQQNGILMSRLKDLLQDHPNAIKQLSDPEEFAAYLYQFWRAGRIKQMGPQNKSLFKSVLTTLRKVAQTFRLVAVENTDMQDVAAIFEAFGAGAFADSKSRDVVIQALEKNATAVAERRANSKAFWQSGVIQKGLRNAVYTAQGTLNDFDNPFLKEVGEWFNTGIGDKFKRQGFLEAKAQKAAEKLNALTNMFKDIEPSDLNILRDALLQRKRPKDAVVGRLFDKVQAHLKDMHAYLRASGVQRFDAETHTWVDIGMIADNYFPRVFDIQKIAGNQEAFVKKLLDTHRPTLEVIAAESNREVANKKSAGKDTASYSTLKGERSGTVTAEDIAAAITARIINGAGAIELDESTAGLGMTPYMRSVNRRNIPWLDDAAFAEYMSQDVVGSLVGYTIQAVKRAEYVKRFGNDGAKLREQMDKALIYEMGGKKLVDLAEKKFPEAIKEWRKAYAKSKASGVSHNDLPVEPTLRSIALEELRAERLAELNKDMSADIKKVEELSAKAYSEVLEKEVAAIQKLQPAAKAVMAMEGTLGYDIDPNVRRLAGAVMTYQNWRLLITGLFGSMVDPLGIIVRGGEMHEAWQAFVRGIKEVRNGWKGEKSNDELSQLAETLGTVDSGTFLDALGQTYSSLFMYGKLKSLNDTLFRINGLEAWNRAMRIQATGAAVGFIKKHLANPTEHSRRYLQDELGLDPADKDLLTADGELNFARNDVKQAVMRWVNTAIMRPNAAMRPLYASDPHYAVFYHLKSFVYTFHKTVLERVVYEAKHGNWAPAAQLLTIYAPVMIAADAVKELLIIGDDDPYWMKSGLSGAMKHGVERANLGAGVGSTFLPIPGIPGMYASGSDEVDFFGPAVDQVKDFLLLPFREDKTLAKELAGALPFGNVVRKYVD